MAFRSWPHDMEPDGTTPQETTEDDFRWSLAAATQDGIDRDFGESLAASIQGDQVVLGTGRGVVAGYGFSNDGPVQASIPPNASSLPRLYRVVARLDVSASRVVSAVLSGTAASNPVLPALTRTDTVYDLPLWSCRRAGGGGAISQLTDERVYVNPEGAVACTSDARPAAPLPGTIAYETDTGRLIYYHGGQWRTAVDATYPTPWQALQLRTGYQWAGSGASAQWRWERPGTVELRGRIARENGEPLPSDSWIGVVPAAARPTAIRGAAVASSQRAGGAVSRVEVRSTSGDPTITGRIWFYAPADGSYQPFWVSLDNFRYDIT